MKQLIQSYKTGEILLVEIPSPSAKPGKLLISTQCSLVSVGTEKHMVEMAKKSLLGKALARPDLVKRVIEKARTDGVGLARQQAMTRLDTPVPLGYSAAGTVVEVGRDVSGFSVGDKVAITGPRTAAHAEFNLAPAILSAALPLVGKNGQGRELSFEEGAFGALGGIALEAVRLADVTLGSTVAVIGLGLLGQIAVQLLSAIGCTVIGMDVDPTKVQLAERHGMDYGSTSRDELGSAVRELTGGQGVDSAVIMAAAKDSTPLELAAEVARERANVVAAGLVSLDVPRKTFYEKELNLVVSRAWGPGLYDPRYVEKGMDYPLAYARWTAQRNVRAFLEQMAKGRVSVEHLVSHRYSFEDALSAYHMILKGSEPYLGVILEYQADKASLEKSAKRIELQPAQKSIEAETDTIGIGFIGAGLFSQGTLLPEIKQLMKSSNGHGISLSGVASSTGLTARHAGKKFGFAYFSSDYRELLKDDSINVIFVVTRHGSHASLATEALTAGKHVFVEKPLALTQEEVNTISEALHTSKTSITVGFNRRFAPTTRWLKERFKNVEEPLSMHCTVNAGYIPADSWVHDPVQGGGRIIGEVCHFVDLLQFLCDSDPIEVYATQLVGNSYRTGDNVSIQIKMKNGSIGSILYVASGDKRYPRERIEVFAGGAVGIIDNFQKAQFTQGGKTNQKKTRGVDRGHAYELEAFVKSIKEGKELIPFQKHIITTLTTFAIEDSLQKGKVANLEYYYSSNL